MSQPAPHAARLAEIPVSEATVEILGSTTRYWVYGPADARWTLVLAHGYRGDHHGLEPVIARLPELRIISPDLPGFGLSTPMTDEAHSISGYVHWLNQFVDHVGVRGSAVILGHSFGSMITSHAVAEGLETPALILVNPISTDPRRGGGPVLNALTRGYYGLARRLPRRIGMGLLGNWIVVQFMSMSLVTTPDKRLRTWIHEEHHRYFNGFSDPDTVAEAFDASLSTQVGEAAGRITVPTILIAGANDMITGIEGQRATAPLFADARLVELPVGHLIHYEAAAEAADAIRGFLAGLDTAPGAPGTPRA